MVWFFCPAKTGFDESSTFDRGKKGLLAYCGDDTTKLFLEPRVKESHP